MAWGDWNSILGTYVASHRRGCNFWSPSLGLTDLISHSTNDQDTLVSMPSETRTVRTNIENLPPRLELSLPQQFEPGKLFHYFTSMLVEHLARFLNRCNMLPNPFSWAHSQNLLLEPSTNSHRTESFPIAMLDVDCFVPNLDIYIYKHIYCINYINMRCRDTYVYICIYSKRLFYDCNIYVRICKLACCRVLQRYWGTDCICSTLIAAILSSKAGSKQLGIGGIRYPWLHCLFHRDKTAKNSSSLVLFESVKFKIWQV